jgi:hypothetical protein
VLTSLSAARRDSVVTATDGFSSSATRTAGSPLFASDAIASGGAFGFFATLAAMAAFFPAVPASTFRSAFGFLASSSITVASPVATSCFCTSTGTDSFVATTIASNGSAFASRAIVAPSTFGE